MKISENTRLCKQKEDSQKFYWPKRERPPQAHAMGDASVLNLLSKNDVGFKKMKGVKDKDYEQDLIRMPSQR